jgi:hypothetical protein
VAQAGASRGLIEQMLADIMGTLAA